MKKILLLTALLSVTISVAAQEINPKAINNRLDKLDKSVKSKKSDADKWIARGDAYFDVAREMTVFTKKDFTKTELIKQYGKPTSARKESRGGIELELCEYTYFTIGIDDEKVAIWWTKEPIRKDLVKTAIESYSKAYEKDSTTKATVLQKLRSVASFSLQHGSICYMAYDYKGSGESLHDAYTAKAATPYDSLDVQTLYLAGGAFLLDGRREFFSNARAAVHLTEAYKLGYRGDGNIYLSLFHAYSRLKDVDPKYLLRAAEILQEGLEKFPGNRNIVETAEALLKEYEKNNPE